MKDINKSSVGRFLLPAAERLQVKERMVGFEQILAFSEELMRKYDTWDEKCAVAV